jgi:transcriptional regulator with XRE-family HTH domain
LKLKDHEMLSGRQISAARALIGMSQATLARAANISLPTLKRMEASESEAAGMRNDVAAVRTTLETAGVAFLEAGGIASGPGCWFSRGTEPVFPPRSEPPLNMVF